MNNAQEYKRPRVSVDTVAMWRLRAQVGVVRWLVIALAVIGLTATVRFTIAPPTRVIVRESSSTSVDLGGESFALLFARQYLTWSAAVPQQHAAGLTSFLGSDVDPDAGLESANSGAENVLWEQLAQATPITPAEELYTVAVDTDRAGLLYLAIDVARNASGALTLGRYPAFVGPPLMSAAQSLAQSGLASVTDPTLSAVITRALTNYLAGSSANLAADLANGALVESPPEHLVLTSVDSLKVLASGAVLAIVAARDDGGTSYTLAYELLMARAVGRWEVLQIETNPST